MILIGTLKQIENLLRQELRRLEGRRDHLARSRRRQLRRIWAQAIRSDRERLEGVTPKASGEANRP